MEKIKRLLAYRIAPNRAILHTLIWIFVLIFYVENYKRLADGQLVNLFVLKDLLIVMVLFYSLPFIMDRWMPRARGFTVGNLLTLLLVGVVGYSLWAGGGALICAYARVHELPTSDNVQYLSELLLNDGFLSVYRPEKFTVLVLDFAFIVSAPLAGRLVYEVKSRDWKNQQLENDVLRADNERLDAQLKQLKAQLNPHFVFNTLNNIHGMVEPLAVRAAHAIERLAELTRYTTYASAMDTMPLAHELEAVDAYWMLSSMRYVDTVILQQDVPASVPDGLHIPPMLLLVYVENAFKHGPSRNPAGAWVRMSIVIDAAELRMVLSNSVDEDAPKLPSGGLGLHHAVQLLETHFPDRYTLDVKQPQGEYHLSLTIKLS